MRRRERSVWGLVALAAIVLAMACSRADTAAPAPASEAPSERFYEALAPYGAWIDTDSHGWAWLPATAIVGSDFFPYLSDGTWRLTDEGWLFESRHAWGWAPFHYGRWTFTPRMGWMWLPGEAWAPAWVDWRWGGGYVAWAPLPPRSSDGEELRSHWLVLAAGDLTAPRLAAHLVPRELATMLFIGTTPERAASEVFDARWPKGPPAHEVESVTGERLTPLQLEPPPPGSIVRSHVEDGAVQLEPMSWKDAARAMPRFTPHPPRMPMHVLNPHALLAPVDAWGDD